MTPLPHITEALMDVYTRYTNALSNAEAEGVILYPSEEYIFQREALLELCRAVDPETWKRPE